MSAHTKEPWRVEYHSTNGFEVWADTSPTGSMRLCSLGFASTFDKANAGRIVACVNACAGIPTLRLETLPAQLFNEWLYSVDPDFDKVLQQREELLTALRNVQSSSEWPTIEADIQDMVCDAIAKVEAA